jgi:hypothetical protein
MGYMVRFIFALLLTFMTVVAPAHAAFCGADGTQVMESCCCGGDVSDCAEIGDTCCDLSSNEQPAAPQPLSIDVPATAAAVTSITPRILKVSLAPSLAARFKEAHIKPVHLASNKLYLEKRSLLI